MCFNTAGLMIFQVKNPLRLAPTFSPFGILLKSRLSSARETVHFARLERADTQFIDAIESVRAVRIGFRQGLTLPANCTATGKAMLSLLDEEHLRKLYPRQEPPRLTTNSITYQGRQGNIDSVDSAAWTGTRDGDRCHPVLALFSAHRMSEELRSDLGVILRRPAARAISPSKLPDRGARTTPRAPPTTLGIMCEVHT